MREGRDLRTKSPAADNKKKGKGAGRRSRRLARSAGAAILAVLAWTGHLTEPRRLSGTTPAPLPPPLLVDSLRPGEHLSTVLQRQGMEAAEADRLAGLLRTAHQPAPETEIELTRGRTPPFTRITAVRFARSRDELVEARATDGRWEVSVVPAPVRRDTLVLSGQIGPDSYYAGQRKGRTKNLDPRYAVVVLSHRLVVEPTLRSGDAYSALVERHLWADGSVKDVRVLAARFHGVGGPVTALLHEMDGEEAYHDAGGAPLTAAYATPVASGRITSRYSRGRFHPVLRRRIPHLGVDYGDWYGTPVRAAAPGKVTYRGWFAGHGRMVEITHSDGRRTRYSHLARYRPGLRTGSRVRQGEIIGQIGDTGISTGPHLHFALIEDGEYVDPLKAEYGSPGGGDGVPTVAGDFLDRAETLVAILSRIEARHPPGAWSLARLDGTRTRPGA